MLSKIGSAGLGQERWLYHAQLVIGVRYFCGIWDA